MKTYHVQVNGTTYEIVLEVIDTPEANSAVSKKAVASPVTTPAPAAQLGNKAVTSPLPGKLLQIHFKAGDIVEKGQVLMILEAMKMENEILAPASGRIVSLPVSVGQQVDAGSLLCELQITTA